jgi:hypothetical protein
MRPQNLLHQALTPTESDHMDAALDILNHPFPLLPVMHAGIGHIPHQSSGYCATG